MELNWMTLGVVIIVIVLLIFFLIQQNWKDEKELEKYLNDNDLPVDKEEEELNNEL